jgi:hypothetical protein
MIHKATLAQTAGVKLTMSGAQNNTTNEISMLERIINR